MFNLSGTGFGSLLVREKRCPFDIPVPVPMYFGQVVELETLPGCRSLGYDGARVGARPLGLLGYQVLPLNQRDSFGFGMLGRLIITVCLVRVPSLLVFVYADTSIE